MEAYLNKLSIAIARHNAAECGRLLSVQGGEEWNVLIGLLKANQVSLPLLQDAANNIGWKASAEWLDSAYYGLVAMSASTPNLKLEPISKLLAHMRGIADEDDWVLGTICMLLDEYRHVAASAGTHDTELNNVAAEVQRVQKVIEKDRTHSGTRKLYLAYLLVIMYRIFLQAGSNLDPVKRFPWLPSQLESIPPCAATSYCFVQGLSAMGLMDYAKAYAFLWQGFQMCPPAANQNMARILLLLVPLAALQGIYAKDELLERYGLYLYCEILDCVREGKLGTLDALIEKHRVLLVHKGIYLLIDRLRYLTLRNLIVKIVQIQNGTRVKWQRLAAALAVTGAESVNESATREMIEVLLNKYLSGAYSEANHTLVLATQERMLRPLRL